MRKTLAFRPAAQFEVTLGSAPLISGIGPYRV